MKTALCLLAIAGASAPLAAQELCRISYSWAEVQTGTTIPVAAPNSTLEFGESARITLSLTALLNGASPMGHTTTYQAPPPPGWGTIRGIGSWQYDLLGDSGTPSAAGTWSSGTALPHPFAVQSYGTPQNNGALLRWISGGQFVAPGATASSVNSVEFFYRVWTPIDYAARTVNFLAQPNISVPDQRNSFLVCYGFENDPPFNESYIGKWVDSDFGGGVNIPIVPAPGSCLVLGSMLLCGRRRTDRLST